MASLRVGFIGLGLMGVPMCQRILAAGFPLTVWNRTLEKTQPLKNAGAQVAATIAELVEQSDIIMLCVTDTSAVKSVVFSESAIISKGDSRKILVDFSSIDPAETKKMAAELLQRTGMQWIDSPVSGGVAGVEQGTLAIMAGGDEQSLNTVRPVLEHLSQRVTHMGPVGSGQVTKVCNQMIVSCNVLVMAEMMALAEKSGVDASLIPTALQGGFADSIPLQLTGPRMANSEFEPVKWHVKTLLKDLDMANTLSASMQSAIPMSGLGAEIMRLHASQGHADHDPSTLIDLYREKKG